MQLPELPKTLLADLDEKIWEAYDEAVCRVLGAMVVQQVELGLTQLRATLAATPLPGLPEGVALDDLELETRTRNALSAEGFEEDMLRLTSLTIGDLLAIPGFGPRSLVDVLTSTESFDADLVNYPWASRRSGQILLYEAQNLLNSADMTLVRSSDPRFGQPVRRLARLLGFKGELSALHELLATVSLDEGRRRPVELIALLQSMRIKLDNCLNLHLEDELLDIMPAEASARNRRALYLRLGWDGSPPRTLQALADEHGMTRESVRKICKQLLSKIEGTRPYTPILSRALAAVSENCPGRVGELEHLLHSRGLVESHFPVESLLAAARTLGWSVPQKVVTLGTHSYVVRSGQEEIPGLLIKAAREAVMRWGMGNVGDVAAKVAVQSGQAVDARFVRKLLEDQFVLHWLDSPGGWFWIPGVPHNRLLTTVRKILSVAGSIGIAELRRGIGRHHRMQGYAPPAEVLLELCRQQPEYDVEGDRLEAKDGLDWREVLSEAERIMVEVLQAAGGALNRIEFEDACRERGMKETTFATYRDYSPLLRKHPQGVYGLRGVPIEGESTRKLPSPEPAEHRVLLAHGREPDGAIWVEYRLSRAAIRGGIVSIPAALARPLEGEYLLGEDAAIPSLVVRHSLAWRLAPFFRQENARPGDRLRMQFDPPPGRRVALQLSPDRA